MEITSTQTVSVLKGNSLEKHHHPLTPIDTPRSESELSFEFDYPTDDEDWEREDPPEPLTKVAMGTIYVPTKHFKPKSKFIQPEWYQMCRPNPSPTRLPKDHPSYDEEERRNLEKSIYILTIQVEGAEIKRKEEMRKCVSTRSATKVDNISLPETTTVQHEIWIEREVELRWDLCSALFRQSMYMRDQRRDRETEQSRELMLSCTDNLRKILKLKPTHPGAKMLYTRCIDRLPHKSKAYLYGPSYTADWIFYANPKSWRIPFYNHKVPRSKLYDPTYRALASHEAPMLAFWHFMDLKDGEGISDARKRANKNACIIQKAYRKRHSFRSKNVVVMQRLYRAHAVRQAVRRKRYREGMAQAVIAKRARGMIWREQLRLMKISIVKIQCMARRRIAMWKLYDLRLSAQHGVAAVEIQKILRGWWRRRCWQLAKFRIRVLRHVVKLACFMNRVSAKRKACIVIQKYYRCFICARKWRIHKETKASIKVQKVFRLVRAKRNYKKYYKSILLLQSAMRRKETTKEVAKMVVQRTEEEVERVENEQEFIEYVEENNIAIVDNFLDTKQGKVLVNAVAKRLINKQRKYRKKRFWLWFKGASKFKIRKARFASLFANYDILGTGRLKREGFRRFISEELCIPMSNEEFEELSSLMDDSIPHGIKKNLSAYFYVTFETLYNWYATLKGWPIAETNDGKSSFAKSSVSLASINKVEYTRAKRKLETSKFFRNLSAYKYKRIARKTILQQSKKHSARNAMARYRAAYKPCGVCKYCQRAFAFQSDLSNHRDGRISRTRGIFRLVLDAHRVKDEKQKVVKRWRLSCIERQIYDQNYLERTHESNEGIKNFKAAMEQQKTMQNMRASKSFTKLRRAASRDDSDKTNILSTTSGNERLKPSKQSAGEIDEVETKNNEDRRVFADNDSLHAVETEGKEVAATAGPHNQVSIADYKVLDHVDDNDIDDASVDDDGNLVL